MDVRIQAALELINRDVRAKHEPCAMARRVGLSVSHFYDLFRRETGTVPARYIRDLRLSLAEDLLLTSCFSIKEIADRVGLQDLSHFVRDFEKRFGSSPRRYRLSARSEHLATVRGGPESWPTNRNCGQ
jgi:AraC-like DNA-binding protein